MAYHHYSKKELDRIFNELIDLNTQGLLSGLGIFVSYAKDADSSFIKVGNISEMSILEIVKNKIEKNLKKFSANTADDLAS